MTTDTTNVIDRAVAYFAPGFALKRLRDRRMLAWYEAAKPDHSRKARRAIGTGDSDVLRAGPLLREQSRHLEQNHDLARGILGTLVQNVVGANGIGIEPQPRRKDGSIHQDFQGELMDLRRDWDKRPEVTWSHDRASMERMLGRSYFRDGEVFAQHLVGSVPGLDHGTKIPYSIEMIESDMVPMDLIDSARGIMMGIQRNAWGRATGYWTYKQHPGEWQLMTASAETKFVSAERMSHLRIIDRIRQARGVSIFAAVLARLDDIKDYEESERIAAKVAASMAAYIKKGSPENYEQPIDGEPRDIRFRPGMVFDDLNLGEEVGTIDTTRPNSNLENHRRGQLRAVACGTGVTYSSAAKDYDGTYSAQRQELVEGWGAYGVLAAEFINGITRPMHENAVRAAIASGRLRVPSDVVLDTVDDALYLPPQMPWIDPDKEAKAWERLETNVHASAPEIIRRRGQNPRDVIEQEALWRKALRAAELVGAADESESDEPEEAQDGKSRTRESRFRA